ncbi:hypothetical protein JJD41_22935 [Oxynema sp. CENA135]|uniref:hypothetical protein n=1 Tax=Oxynema sp. CENA135 TaxID=984206 RepID=UPI00190E3D75|nr:hypothetical protein [Oxynema sp. CENA135]MBK4732698.1 hypothetical protein [Oxynema sp. CENA135]
MKPAIERSPLPFSPTFLLRLATIAASALLGVRGLPEPLLAVATPENETNVVQKIAQSTEADDATPLGKGITTGTIAPGETRAYKELNCVIQASNLSSKHHRISFSLVRSSRPPLYS